MKKRQLPKTVAVILICVLIDIALHFITSAYSTMPANPNYSKLAALFGTEITATLWAILAFSGAAWVFSGYKIVFPEMGLQKGFVMELEMHCYGNAEQPNLFYFLQSTGLRFSSLCPFCFPAF